MRFDGKRRPAQAIYYGLGWLIGMAILIAVVVGQRGKAGMDLATYLGLAGVGGLIVSVVIAALPRDAWIELDGDQVLTSWRGPIARGQPTLGRLVLPGLDAPIGVAVHLGTDARIVIGGAGLTGGGLAITAPPVRRADVELGASAFTALLERLPVPRQDRDHAAIALVPSSQSAAGLMRMMGPWLITIAIASGFGLVLAATGLDERALSTPHGPLVIGGITMAIVLGGMTWTIVANSRIKRPERELRLDPRGVALVDTRGAQPVERARATWAAVGAQRARYVIRGRGTTTTLPALTLTIGDETVAVTVWDPQHAWPDDLPKVRRAPRWLCGAPEWPVLIAALRGHGRL